MSTVQLVESVKTKPLRQPDGTYKIVLITPGLGSTGDYSEELIRTYAAETWPIGTHSYVDHPTASNPGRSPKNLIGTFVTTPYYEEGVGAVSFLKPKKHWESFIEEVAADCGMSIYAQGTGKKEMREGREVTVVESFVPSRMNTVDLVSYAGRGGHFTESAEALFESALEHTSEADLRLQVEKKENELMATLEEMVKALSDKFDVFVAEQVAAREEHVAKEAKVVESAEAVKGAIAATRAVEAAEVPKSVKDNLFAAIEGGNYDVTPRLEEVKALREEMLAESQTSGGGRNVQLTEAEKAELDNVKGW